MNPDDEIMYELHRIREAHYEKIKDLSPEQQLAFDARKVEEIKRKYHLSLPKVRTISDRYKE